MATHILSLHKERWPLRNPFRITGYEWTDLNAIVVEISDGQHTGRGEAAGVFYEGENAETIYEQVADVRNEVERSPDRDALLELLPPGGARNAIDCALWDLEAKRTGSSAWALAGVRYKPVQTVMTIPIRDTAEEMGENAAALSAYPNLKVKLDSDRPVERLEAIRNARPDATIVVDANQGFTLDLLETVLPDCERLDISMVEQPLPRGADDGLEGFESPVPLCADESCLHLGELDQAARRYQMINIKLDKCGGLTEGLALAAEAEKRGLELMVGNMFGTSLAMLPALIIAQRCRFVDLDGPLHLRDDRLPGLHYDNGQVSMPVRPLWGGIDP